MLFARIRGITVTSPERQIEGLVRSKKLLAMSRAPEVPQPESTLLSFVYERKGRGNPPRVRETFTGRRADRSKRPPRAAKLERSSSYKGLFTATHPTLVGERPSLIQ